MAQLHPRNSFGRCLVVVGFVGVGGSPPAHAGLSEPGSTPALAQRVWGPYGALFAKLSPPHHSEPPMSMFTASVPQLHKMLGNLEHWLDEANEGV